MLTRNRPNEPEGTFTRAVPVAPSTWNAEAQTIVIVLSAGAPVMREDRRGVFHEILDVRGAVIPERLPLLDSHNRHQLEGRLGEVTDIHLAGNQLVGTARLSRHSPLAQRIAAEIADGARFGISIGYSVPPGKWVERTNPTTKRREKVATTFDLLEASLVAIPADPAATTRSNPMDPEETTTVETTTTTTQPAQMTRAQINVEIRSIARTAGLDQAWVDGQIDTDATLDAVRAAALSAMQQRSQTNNGIRSTVRVVEDHADPVAIRSAMAGALAHRLSSGTVSMEGRAAEFRSHSVLDLVGDLAIARGESINIRDREALLERAVGTHSTSDFPLLLADAANRTLLANYQAAAPSYRQWAARRPFRDFRDHSFLRIGDFPEFKEIAENGETKYGSISENAEKVRAKEFGTGLAIGRRALINDDLSALSDFSAMIAIRAASDENRKVYGVLLANGNLSDGKAIFHADHGNLQTGAALSVESVGITVAALRKQKSKDGVALNLHPKYLIVGPDQELKGRQVLAAITPTKAADANPWAGALELVVDAEITGNAWYIAVAPETAPSIIYGYVAGSEGPQIRTEVDFDTRAVKVAAGLDFAAGAIDFRGLQKNPGA